MKTDVKTRDSAQEIETRAAEWAARVDARVPSARDRAELDAWLSADARHAGAYARARAIAYFSHRAAALGPDFDPRSFVGAVRNGRLPLPDFSRRQLLWGSSALAASAGIVAVAAEGLLGFTPTYASALGQMRVVALADGSVVNLNTGSRIRVDYSRHRRDIWLDEGEALFDVAKDAARPFVVRAGAIHVIAVGTSFVVRKLADKPVQVLVREGVVEVDNTSPNQPIRMVANMTALSTASGTPSHANAMVVSHVEPQEVERATAWLNGRLAFEDDTLHEAVSEFSRYSDVSIVIDDPSIARERITGVYQTVDPVGFAKSASVIFGLKTDITEKKIRLYR
jgi:transmembrane sensor